MHSVTNLQGSNFFLAIKIIKIKKSNLKKIYLPGVKVNKMQHNFYKLRKLKLNKMLSSPSTSVALINREHESINYITKAFNFPSERYQLFASKSTPGMKGYDFIP